MDTNETYPSMKLYTSVCVLLDERTTQRDDLLAAAQRVAHIPCEREGNIHCSMLPPDSTLKPCPWCAIRAAIAKAEEAKQ